MTLELALRLTELLLAVAWVQSSAEHIFGPTRQVALFMPRAILAGLVIADLGTVWALLGLTIHSLVMLYRFGGPYNGGSDRMGLLILYCLTVARWLPQGADLAMGYLAVQVTLAYFISGRVKIVNADWRSGQALADVFAFSAYPVSTGLRQLANRRQVLWLGSWAVMLLEVLFPLALLHPTALMTALSLAAAFHVANACFFGLNRFVWVWLAAYPTLFWFQGIVGEALK